MKRHEWLIFFATLAVYLALRGGDLLGPFILPFENAFQEAVALHHLPDRFLENRFLSVIARFGGRNYYHTAHPPLLHLLYAGLYGLFGVHEWVTRGFALLCFLASFVLWRRMLRKETVQGWRIFLFTFFLPVPFLLITTTNYEPLSIFMVSLLAWLVLFRGAGLQALIPALTFGLLVDWPVYLAVPALLLMKWGDRQTRRRLLILFGYESVFFLALQAYQYAVAGEAAFFSHAPARANPLAIFSADTWRELFSNYLQINGAPLTILSLAVFLSWLITEARASRTVPSPDTPGRFFAFFLLLLLLSAPRLVSRHHVYLLYFSPLLALTFFHAAQRLKTPFALLALLFLLGSRDYLLALDRNPSYWWMAKTVGGCGGGSAFASSAVGAWKFYGGIETAHPVSAAVSRWLERNQPEILHLDVAHAEVGQFKEMTAAAKSGNYRLWLTLPGEEVWVTQKAAKKLPRYFHLPRGGSEWQEPSSLCVVWREEESLLDAAVDGSLLHRLRDWRQPPFILRSHYCLRQPPGPDGSAVVFHLPSDQGDWLFYPRIYHVLPFGRSDGVSFMAVAEYNKKKKAERLIFSRFVSDEDVYYGGRRKGGRPRIQNLPLAGASRLRLMTLPGPRRNSSFDDAYWIQLGPEEIVRAKERNTRDR